MTNQDLSERHVIVTGASSGIGEQTARDLANLGAKVTLVARRVDRLEALAEEIRQQGGEARVEPVDVTKRPEVEAMSRNAVNAFGPVDILVNNAGIMPLSLMKNLHLDEWEAMVDVNIKGVLFCLGAVLPKMIERSSGHIVNVSSVAGRTIFPSAAVYCGTKFAVRAISEGLRMELAPTAGIRVTCIEPGAVATELALGITDPDVAAMSAKFQQMRILDPVDISQAITYAVTQPDHVNVAEVLVLPRDQAN